MSVFTPTPTVLDRYVFSSNKEVKVAKSKMALDKAADKKAGIKEGSKKDKKKDKKKGLK